MTSDCFLYKEIYRYSREKIWKIIFSAITIVIAFGVTIIGIHIKGDFEIVAWSNEGIIPGIFFTLVFVISWVCYFGFLRHLENNMVKSIIFMHENNVISQEERDFSLSIYDSRAKYIPFAISSILYVAVVGPF